MGGRPNASAPAGPTPGTRPLIIAGAVIATGGLCRISRIPVREVNGTAQVLACSDAETTFPS